MKEKLIKLRPMQLVVHLFVAVEDTEIQKLERPSAERSAFKYNNKKHVGYNRFPN